jgi:hypothetical protein
MKFPTASSVCSCNACVATIRKRQIIPLVFLLHQYLHMNMDICVQVKPKRSIMGSSAIARTDVGLALPPCASMCTVSFSLNNRPKFTEANLRFCDTRSYLLSLSLHLMRQISLHLSLVYIRFMHAKFVIRVRPFVLVYRNARL